jgi:hypothetical protein
MERCTRCILPRSYRAVSFDPAGTCSLCREHAPETAAAERAALADKRAELEDIVEALREEGRGRRYDCIVLLSGGLDSSYVAYVMAREYGLRLLGLNVDNGYRTPLALANMDSLVSRLGIGMVTLKPDPGLYRRVFAHFFRTTGYFCTVCNGLGYVLAGSFAHREARLRGTKPLMVGGWSRKYEYQPGLSVLSMKAFGDRLREDAGLYAAVAAEPLIEPGVLEAFVQAGDIRQLTSASAETPDDRLRMIQLPSCLDWDYRRIVRTLETELGWRRQQGRHEAHFDCRLAPVQEFLKHRRFGFSQETIKNSVLVREGRMTRAEALGREDREQKTEPAVLAEVLAEWDMERADVGWDAPWAE